MKAILTFVLLCVILLANAAWAAEPVEKKAGPQVIILKLDDVTQAGAHGAEAVSARWQRVTDFIVENKLKGAFGIIGHSLEEDSPVYFEWIKKLDKSGTIEFWNHGYKDRQAADKTGEFEGSFEEQQDSLEKTQRLAREKLGIGLRVFGAHWSGTNDATAKALAGIPEIKMVFYDPKGAKQFVFERVLTLENPTFVPDFEKFKALYEAKAADKPVLALQGHPNGWDDKRWAGFVKIVEYLIGKGCVFMTPSEYLAKAERGTRNAE